MKLYIDKKSHKCHLPDCDLIKKISSKRIIEVDDEIKNYDDNCDCIFKYKFMKEVQFYCQKYKIEYEYKFNAYFIKSKINRWRFDIPNNNHQKIILYHKNLYYCSNSKVEYHVQFSKHISTNNLIKYIYNHDNFKYSI